MADKLPEFQQQEKLEANLLPQGIGRATKEFAESGSFLGEMSTRVMQAAAQERALQQGYELGETPQGDLGPAITSFDKTVAQAYKSRSQAVLGIQAQKLLNDSQEAVSQSQISPDAIKSYTESTAKGLDDILQNAPKGVKESLQSQYSQSLQNSIHQLNLKLTNKTKSDNAKHYSSYSASSFNGIQSSSIMGDSESSQIALDKYREFNKENLDSGTINQETYNSNENAALLSKDSGESISKAIEARHQGKLSEYMSLFSDINNKPKEMSLSHWDAIAKNTNAYMTKMISYKKAQDQQISTELSIKATAGVLSGSELSAATSTMETEAAKKAIFNVQKIQARNQDTINNTNAVLENKENASTLSSYTPKEIDRAHAQLTQNYMDASEKNETPISPDEAEAKSAMDIATPVSSYINKMNHGVLFGNADSAARASAAKKLFASQNKSQLFNLSKEANAKLANYDLLVDSGGLEPNEAFQKATELATIDKTVRETRNAAWSEESSKNLSDTKSQTKKGRSLTGLSNHWFGWFDTPLANQDVMVRTALTLYKENFLLTGSLAAAEKATSDAMKAKVSNTDINGAEEAAFRPITLEIGLPKDGNSSIWSDVNKQMAESFEQMKEQYDRKELNYYYEVVPSENNEPPKVLKKFRNGGESEFNLRIDAHRGESTTMGTNYNISLKNKLASGLLFDQLPNAKNGLFIYSPDKESIEKDYIEKEEERRELKRKRDQIRLRLLNTRIR